MCNAFEVSLLHLLVQNTAGVIDQLYMVLETLRNRAFLLPLGLVPGIWINLPLHEGFWRALACPGVGDLQRQPVPAYRPHLVCTSAMTPPSCS